MAGALRVVMTGGTGRLGSAVLQALVARGATVASTVHTRLDRAEGLPATFRAVDLADADAVGPAVRALAEGLGGVDVFLHAAGVASTDPGGALDRLDGFDVAGFDRLFAVNVRSALLAIRALAPALAGGQVVLLGSVGAIKAMESPIPLTASHGALLGMARALAKDLGPAGTRVNLLALPPLSEGASASLPDALRAEYVKHAALRRIASPEEAAAAIASFVLHNRYVTGQGLALDGGL